MRTLWILIFCCLGLTNNLKANTDIANMSVNTEMYGQPYKKKIWKSLQIFRFASDKLNIERNAELKSSLKLKKSRAVLMALLTGLLGGHRLYLGTKPYVPVVYTLTLGGGMGLLPLIDIFVILLTDDLSKYQNNSQIIMWGEI